MIVFYDMDLPDDEGGGGGGSKAPAATVTVPAASISAPAPTKVNPLPITAPKAPVRNPNLIPLPDYSDPKSRINFLQNWQKQYGPLEGRGDTLLKLNEVPRGGS